MTPKKTKYIQGLYKPRYKNKYKGNIKQIIYRSSYELQFMNYCDNSNAILEWASEEIVIPYIKPTDKRVHNYYLDFWIKYVSDEYEKQEDYWELVDISKLTEQQQTKAKLIIENKSNITPIRGKSETADPKIGKENELYHCTESDNLYIKRRGHFLISEKGYKIKKIKKAIIEIKPENQVNKPKQPQRITIQFKKKMITWCINQAKWESAHNFARKNNMEFKIITEKFLKNSR